MNIMIDVMIMRDHVIDIHHRDNDHPCQIIVVEMILVEVPKSEWFVFIQDLHKIGGGLVNIQGQGVDHLIYIERKEVQMGKEKNIKTIMKNSGRILLFYFTYAYKQSYQNITLIANNHENILTNVCLE